jgi:hypothetical protein
MAQMTDILEEIQKTDLSKLKLVFPSFPTKSKNGLFFDHLTYWEETSKFDFVDVLTYTYKSSLLPRRVVTAFGEPRRSSIQEVRVCDQLHTKLVIGYKNQKVSACYIGSTNWSGSGHFNLMLKVDKNLHEILTCYFEHIWKHAVKI